MTCFLTAFAILAVWHFYHGLREGHWYRPPLFHGDGPDYESLAYSLRSGEGFQFAWQSDEWQRPYREDSDSASYSQMRRVDWPGPTASRPPLYPGLIASVYWVVPRGPLGFAAVRSVSVFCTVLSGAIAVCLAFELVSKLFGGRWVALLAASATLSLALLDRTIRSYSVDFLTEPLAMLLCTCIALFGLRWQARNNGRSWFILLVIAAALSVLARSMIVFWLPGLAILVGLSAERFRVRWMCLFLLSTVVCLSPWWVRNCLVLERWMPLGGQGAASLSGGYCDEALADRGNWHGRVEEELQRELDAVPGASEWTQAQREVALADRAMLRTKAWFFEHSGQLPGLIGMRVATHWSPYFGASLWWRMAIVAGWFGLAWLRRRELVWILGLPVLSTATVAILYETGGRFLVPLHALLYATAGVGVAIAVRWIFCNPCVLFLKKRS